MTPRLKRQEYTRVCDYRIGTGEEPRLYTIELTKDNERLG